MAKKPPDEHVLFLASSIQAAEDFGYPEEVIDQLRKAKSDIEVSRIMATARERDLAGEAFKTRRWRQ